MGHFNALARLTEHYGAFDGLAGGSSSTITMFLYESMLQSPGLHDCGGQACTPEQVGVRLSFLLKSMWGYIHALSGTPEARTLFDLIGTVQKHQAKLKAGGLKALAADASPAEALAMREKLKAVLHSPELHDLANPEYLLLLEPESPELRAQVEPEFLAALGELTPARKIFLLNEAYVGLKSFGTFKATDRKILFRPGLISFAALARKIGRIANFYAGRGFTEAEAAELKASLDACAEPSRDQAWSEIQAGNSACAARVETLMASYRGRILALEHAGQAPSFRSRELDRVGDQAHVLVSAAILEKPATAKFKAGLARYLRGEDPAKFDLNIFGDLKFGYWGHESDIARVSKLGDLYPDYRSRHALGLGPLTWLEAIRYSPAEPGLSRFNFVAGSDGLMSGAGWSDLSPVQALRSLGCENVTYVTRIGVDAQFAQDVATSLGMKAAERKAIYDIANPASSYAVAVREANAVWCTNWDIYTPQTLGGLNMDSYNARLELVKPPAPAPFRPYARTLPATHLGCGGRVATFDEP
jgi:hypothetical protein